MMNEGKKLLSLGSVVLLEEGLQKLVIVGRGAVYTDQQSKKDTFADYMAVLYPSGLNPETTIFLIIKISIKLFLKDIVMKKK